MRKRKLFYCLRSKRTLDLEEEMIIYMKDFSGILWSYKGKLVIHIRGEALTARLIPFPNPIRFYILLKPLIYPNKIFSYPREWPNLPVKLSFFTCKHFWPLYYITIQSYIEVFTIFTCKYFSYIVYIWGILCFYLRGYIPS